MEELIRQFIDICSGIGWVFSKMDDWIIFTMLMTFFVFLAFLKIVTTWSLLKKAGAPGTASLLQIYGDILLIQKARVPKVYLIAYVIIFALSNYLLDERTADIISLTSLGITYMIVSHYLANAFGRTALFSLGLIFLPLIFYPLLGLGNYEYEG